MSTFNPGSIGAAHTATITNGGSTASTIDKALHHSKFMVNHMMLIPDVNRQHHLLQFIERELRHAGHQYSNIGHWISDLDTIMCSMPKPYEIEPYDICLPLCNMIDDHLANRPYDMHTATQQFCNAVIAHSVNAATGAMAPPPPQASQGAAAPIPQPVLGSAATKPVGVDPFEDNVVNKTTLTDATIKEIRDLARKAECKEACEFYQTISCKTIQKILKLLGG